MRNGYLYVGVGSGKVFDHSFIVLPFAAAIESNPTLKTVDVGAVFVQVLVSLPNACVVSNLKNPPQPLLLCPTVQLSDEFLLFIKIVVGADPRL